MEFIHARSLVTSVLFHYRNLIVYCFASL